MPLLTLTVRQHTITILFFFNDTATTEIYTLSLHDALPISQGKKGQFSKNRKQINNPTTKPNNHLFCEQTTRSEEHTSELQSHLNLVCRLLLEKKKKKKNRQPKDEREYSDLRSHHESRTYSK